MRRLVLLAAACCAAKTTRRAPLLWMHVHKAAGTTIRHLAALNGEVPLQPATTNWNLFLNDRERVAGLINCTARLELFAAQESTTWSSIERPFERSDVCDGSHVQMHYGIALRDPMDTAESTLNYNDIDAEEVAAKLRAAKGSRRNPRDVGPFSWHRGVVDHVSPLGHFDNFLTRSLLGRAAFDEIPIGGVTPDHLAQALRVLETFDVVLALDDLEAHVPQFALRDWAVDAVPRLNAHPDRKPIANETRDLLRAHSAIDVLLYEEARRLAHRKTAAATKNGAVSAEDVKKGAHAAEDEDDRPSLSVETTTLTARSSASSPEEEKEDDSTCGENWDRHALPAMASSSLPTPVAGLQERAFRECAGFLATDYDEPEERPAPPRSPRCDSDLRVVGVASTAGQMAELFDHLCGLGYVVAAAEGQCNFEALPATRRDGALEALQLVRDGRRRAFRDCFDDDVKGDLECDLEWWSASMRSALTRLATSGVEAVLDLDLPDLVPSVLARAADDVVVVHSLLSPTTTNNGTVCKPELWPTALRDDFSPLNSFEVCGDSEGRSVADVATPLSTLSPLLRADVMLRANTRAGRVAREAARTPDRYLPYCSSFESVRRLRWRRAKDTRTGRPTRTLSDGVELAHVVVTTLGVGVEDDAERLEAQLLVFEAFTVASMIRQTTSDGVAWVLYARLRRWPAQLAKRLRDIVAPWARFRVVDGLPAASDDTADRHLRRAGVYDVFSAAESGEAGVVSLVSTLEAGDSLHTDALREMQAAVVERLDAVLCGQTLTTCSKVAYEWTPAERGNYGAVSPLARDDAGACWNSGLTRATALQRHEPSKKCARPRDDAVVIELPQHVAPLRQRSNRPSSVVQRRNSTTSEFLRRVWYTLESTMAIVAVANAHLLRIRRDLPWHVATARLERLCSSRGPLDRAPCFDVLARLGVTEPGSPRDRHLVSPLHSKKKRLRATFHRLDSAALSS